MIRSMTDLLVETGHDDFDGLQDAVYEYTDSGACIEHDSECIRIHCVDEPDALVERVLLFYPFEAEKYHQALQSVKEAVRTLWMENHGCEGCNLIAGGLYDKGECPVQPGCPMCNGEGVTI